MLEQQCRGEADAFRGDANHLAAGSAVVAYTSHYNMQRHECLVEITGNRSTEHGQSTYEQIFDPTDGAFVASRDSPLGVRTARAIVMGAPVPAQRESAAQVWFNDLMTK
jgi:hypothetical protein